MDVHIGTRKLEQFRINRTIALLMLAFGIASCTLSAFYNSTVAAVVGLGIIFWGAILLYITPSRHVTLELLNATATSTLINLEKIMVDSNLSGIGVYLPPQYLKKRESSLVFISGDQQSLLPPEEIDEEKLYQEKTGGICLTPPGLALSKLFEKELGASFTRTDLTTVQQQLPKLLIENLEIADSVEVRKESSTITVDISNHVFKEICEEARKLPRTHASLGCPLSSAIACALAKAAGKPVTVQKEEQTNDGRKTRIQYHIFEG
jgi:hypothetical protein